MGRFEYIAGRYSVSARDSVLAAALAGPAVESSVGSVLALTPVVRLRTAGAGSLRHEVVGSGILMALAVDVAGMKSSDPRRVVAGNIQTESAVIGEAHSLEVADH